MLGRSGGHQTAKERPTSHRWLKRSTSPATATRTSARAIPSVFWPGTESLSAPLITHRVGTSGDDHGWVEPAQYDGPRYKSVEARPLARVGGSVSTTGRTVRDGDRVSDSRRCGHGPLSMRTRRHFRHVPQELPLVGVGRQQLLP